MGKLFGTDGIRGVANLFLTPNLSYRVGRAAGYVLSKGDGDKRKKALVARDTRFSGDLIETSLVSGLLSIGIDVDILGIAPTPAVAYITRCEDYILGVQISASHNPYEYNGIKLFSKDGLKLADEIEAEIEEIIESNTTLYKNITQDKIGRVNRNNDLINLYTKHLKENAGDFSNYKIALDIGNGALYNICEDILISLGAKTFAINDRPDGKNINDRCGSTNPSLIVDLVKEKKADIGMSFDGDADRIIAVDENGDIVDGDHILAIFAKYMKDSGKLKNNCAVGTVMSNISLENYLKDQGIDFLRTQVGDRYILEQMLKNDYSVGAEQSGHVILLDKNTTGDGLFTGIMLLNIMKESNKKLSQLNALFKSAPQVTVNAHVRDDLKKKYLDFDEIKKEIEKIEKKYFKSGRVLIRPSGTEPVIRVMIEGDGKLEEDARALAKFIEGILN